MLSSALLTCAGCGGPHESSVSGTVFLDGQPLTLTATQAGNVTFYPSAGGAAAYGQLAADGKYELSTGSEVGLKTGEYKVVVVATENPPAAVPGQAPPPGTRITPEKYSNIKTTDLVVTVDAGSNEIDLQMESP